jgi:hypothetical protein
MLTTHGLELARNLVVALYLVVPALLAMLVWCAPTVHIIDTHEQREQASTYAVRYMRDVACAVAACYAATSSSDVARHQRAIRVAATEARYWRAQALRWDRAMV